MAFIARAWALVAISWKTIVSLTILKLWKSHRISFMQLCDFGGIGVGVMQELRVQMNSASSILGRSKGGKSIFLIRKVQI